MAKRELARKTVHPAYRLTQFVLDWWAEFFLSVPTFIGILISAFPQASLTVNGREIAISSTLLLLAMVCGITGGVGVVKNGKVSLRFSHQENERNRAHCDFPELMDISIAIQQLSRQNCRLLKHCHFPGEKTSLP